MGSFDEKWLLDMLLVLPPLLLSLTLHEYAHARAALAFGDPTAASMGRLTLNPLKHLDPIGTIMLIFSGVIGWAKPVPVNPFNLRPRRLGDIVVSLAGPLTNLALAIVTAMLLKIWILKASIDGPMYWGVFRVLWRMSIANLGMCFFNLIPLFPLDGHHVARELLPPTRQDAFMRWQMSYGAVLLLVLLLGPMAVETITGRPLAVDPLDLYLRTVITPILNFLTG